MLDPGKKYAGLFLLRAAPRHGPALYSRTASQCIPAAPTHCQPFTPENPTCLTESLLPALCHATGWDDGTHRSVGSWKQPACQPPSSAAVNPRGFAPLPACKHRHAAGSAVSRGKLQPCTRAGTVPAHSPVQPRVSPAPRDRTLLRCAMKPALGVVARGPAAPRESGVAAAVPGGESSPPAGMPRHWLAVREHGAAPCRGARADGSATWSGIRGVGRAGRRKKGMS